MAKVGFIQVRNQDSDLGIKLLNEVQLWLKATGWGEVVTASFQPATTESFVDFVPGKYQSNGPKRILLPKRATIMDLQDPLAKWLWELEED
ncbi:hypothetical protein [Bdellovibrio sp. HCB337]|uniref:hypothetical protein n=1 Tax=Bdellovibrio sp. HCB337 TaxID=3394358 RepID=UPI0039A74A82